MSSHRMSTRIWTSRRLVSTTTLCHATGTTGMRALTATSSSPTSQQTVWQTTRTSSEQRLRGMHHLHHTSTQPRLRGATTARCLPTPASLSQAQSMPSRPIPTSSSTTPRMAQRSTSTRSRQTRVCALWSMWATTATQCGHPTTASSHSAQWLLLATSLIRIACLFTTSLHRSTHTSLPISTTAHRT